jgi:Mg2+ and Co2+ transporter CorA|tara:strand:- start:12 stop:287 length:276 start_codon:yes stop_codon:yes gene_type:complete
MATEISENTKLQLNIKTIIAIIVLVSSFVGQYYVLSNEIELAKRLPESEISRSELDLKLELISKTVMSNAEKLGKIENQVEKIEERVYELK